LVAALDDADAIYGDVFRLQHFDDSMLLRDVVLYGISVPTRPNTGGVFWTCSRRLICWDWQERRSLLVRWIEELG
jgi:hypothetical protein